MSVDVFDPFKYVDTYTYVLTCIPDASVRCMCNHARQGMHTVYAHATNKTEAQYLVSANHPIPCTPRLGV